MTETCTPFSESALHFLSEGQKGKLILTSQDPENPDPHDLGTVVHEPGNPHLLAVDGTRHELGQKALFIFPNEGLEDASPEYSKSPSNTDLYTRYNLLTSTSNSGQVVIRRQIMPTDTELFVQETGLEDAFAEDPDFTWPDYYRRLRGKMVLEPGHSARIVIPTAHTFIVNGTFDQIARGELPHFDNSHALDLVWTGSGWRFIRPQWSRGFELRDDNVVACGRGWKNGWHHAAHLRSGDKATPFGPKFYGIGPKDEQKNRATSSRHFTIKRDPDGLSITDHSKNGTYVTTCEGNTFSRYGRQKMEWDLDHIVLGRALCGDEKQHPHPYDVVMEALKARHGNFG